MNNDTLEKMNLDEEKFIKNLTNEINNIEKTIKYQKIIDKKNNLVKNIKINLKYTKVLFPYIIAAFITLKTFNFLGFGLPFKKDIVKKNAYLITSIDYLGNRKDSIQYKHVIEQFFSGCKIYLYSDWKINENDEYERTIKEISLIDYTNDEIDCFLSGEQDIEKYNIKEKKEVKTYILEDDLIKDNNIKIKICAKAGDEDFIFGVENSETNIYSTFVILVFLLWSEYIAFILSPKKEIKEEIDLIKKEYPELDIDNLKTKLKIKKSNLNKLTR